MEGDIEEIANDPETPWISIHALRVEGDWLYAVQGLTSENFYPRPPGGGRHLLCGGHIVFGEISIHALRVEGDAYRDSFDMSRRSISIHALRVEGDCRQVDDFRSTLRISIHALRVEGDLSK